MCREKYCAARLSRDLTHHQYALHKSAASLLNPQATASLIDIMREVSSERHEIEPRPIFTEMLELRSMEPVLRAALHVSNDEEGIAWREVARCVSVYLEE